MMKGKGFTMKVKTQTIVMPLPDESLIKSFEEYYGPFIFPEDYRRFLKEYNGVIPETRVFNYHDYEYVVERFLCLLDDDTEDYQNSPYDIGVIITQLDDRLLDEWDEDETGYKIIPIAALFAGNFVCLDYRTNDIPSIAIWFHEESDEFNPCLVKIADSFSEFIEMLY